MRISDKIKISKIIINLVVLIFIYVFSFHIFPKLGTYNQIDYTGVKTNSKKIFAPMYINDTSFNTSESRIILISKQKDEFLNSYMRYLKKNQDLIANAPCPSELVANNLYNIQIYNNKDIDFLNDDNNYGFNVRFSFFYFFRSLEKVDINKCFNYFFRENINKYFLLYREKTIEDLENEIISLKVLNNFNKINNYENLIKIIKANNFFIEPDVRYAVVQKNNKTTSKIVIFFICLLIVVSINIMYKKLNKKQISKFINKKWSN